MDFGYIITERILSHVQKSEINFLQKVYGVIFCKKVHIL